MENNDGARQGMFENDAPAKDAGSGASNSKLMFRPESMRRHASRSFGEMSLAVPLPFSWYSTAAISLTAMIVAFLAMGSYTTTETSEAVIQTQAGIFEVKGEGQGIVAKLYVREGERVRKGQKIVDLRRIETEEMSADQSSGENERSGGADGADGEGGSPGASGEDGGATGPENTTEEHSREQVSKENEDGEEEKAKAQAGITTVRSPMDAIVYQLPLDIGNNYNNYMSVFKLAGDGDLVVTTRVSGETHGLLDVDDAVEIRLKAFKGTRDARVIGRVASIAMTPSEDWNPKTRTTVMKYKVVIAIDIASTTFDTEDLLGKDVEIRVPVRKRKIYQWLFDPLNAIFGND